MLTILAYGDSKVGKSWFGGSAPKPLLVLDAEGRGRYLPDPNKVYWDVMKDPPPAAGDWTTCIAPVTDYKVLPAAYKWLVSGQHPFVGVDLDSLTEIQKRYIDQLVGMNALEQQDWGSVLRHLEALVRDYRDLVLLPNNSVECVCFIAGETEDEGKRRPLLQGGLRKHLPYLVDACGYMYVTHDAEGTVARNMLVAPAPTIVAGDGTNRLGGPVIAEPNLTTLFEELNT
jgi:hypothetical protein